MKSLSSPIDGDFDYSHPGDDELLALKQAVELHLDKDALDFIVQAVYLSLPPIDQFEDFFFNIKYRIAELLQFLQIDQNMSLLADAIASDPELHWCLLVIVKSSATVLRELPGIGQAAANAISILNLAKIYFSDMDLSGIVVPGADLSDGIFDHTNLAQTNLTGVRLPRAWLGNANLRGACLQDVQLGERPFLQHPENITHIVYSPDGQFLATVAGKVLYLWSSEGVLRYTLNGHAETLSSISFSPDSQMLASGSHDSTVRLWAVQTGNVQHIFTRHKGQVNKVLFNSSGQMLASCSNDAVLVWDVSSKKLVAEFNFLTRGRKIVLKDLAFCFGERLAFSREDEIYLYHIPTQKLQKWKDDVSWKYRGGDYLDDGTLTMLMVSQDGKTLAFINEDCRTAFLWNITSGAEPISLEMGGGAVTDMGFNPKYPVFVYATALSHGNVYLYDFSTQQSVQLLHGKSPVIKVAFSSNGEMLVLGSVDNMLQIWDVRHNVLKKFLSATIPREQNICFSPDMKNILIAGAKNELRLLEISDVSTNASLQETPNRVEKLVMVAGEFLAFLSKGRVELRSLFSGQQLFCLSIPELKIDEYSDAPLSLDGKRLLCRSDKNPMIQVWDVVQGKLESSFPIREEAKRVFYIDSSQRFSLDALLRGSGRGWHTESPEKKVTRAYFSPDGETLALILDSNEIYLRHIAGGTIQARLKHHSFGRIERIVFSPDGKYFAYLTGHDLAGEGGFFIANVYLCRILHDVVTVQPLEDRSALSLIDNPVFGVVFSPGSNFLAAAWRDGTLKLWDVNTGRLRIFKKNERAQGRVSMFSPDGHLYAVDSGRDIALWNVLSGEQEVLISGTPEGLVNQAMFSSRGKILLAFNVDSHTPWLLNISTRALVTLQGHGNKVTCINISPDEKLVASGGLDHTLRFWNITGQCLVVLDGYLDALKSIVWHINYYLVANDAGGAVKGWRINSASDSSLTCQLIWANYLHLYAKGCELTEAVGLSALNCQLLQERGARGEPTLQATRANALTDQTRDRNSGRVAAALSLPTQAAAPSPDVAATNQFGKSCYLNQT